MATLAELIAAANAKSAQPKAQTSQVKTKEMEKPAVHKTKVESSQPMFEEDSFDLLEDTIQDIAVTSVEPSFNMGISKDGNKLELGDPVTGIHKGQNMRGEVVGIEGDNITVQWKDKTVTQVKADTLTMTNVDDDMMEETMYIESVEPIQNMGFDKESFVEDTDLDSLLRGSSSSTGSSYNFNGDL